MISLSWITITKKLTTTTPLCVVLECARCLGVQVDIASYNSTKYRRAITNQLNKATPVTCNYPVVSDEDKMKCARFLNPNEEWEPVTLINAIEYFRILSDMDEIRISPLFHDGPPTNHAPRSLNCCILYRYCKDRLLPVTFRHTADQLAQATRMLFSRPDENKKFMRVMIDHCTSNSTTDASLYLSITKVVDVEFMDEYSDEDVTFNDVERYGNIFEDHRLTLGYLNPENDNQAICLAALRYDINLISFNDPMSEYQNLRRCKLVGEQWWPLEKEKHDDMMLDVSCFDISCRFDPMLPSNLYDTDALDRMAIAQGYSFEDLRQESAYSLLSSALLVDTFYHGRRHPINNRYDVTPVTLDSVSELPFDLCLSYGNKEGYTTMTYIGLADHLKSSKTFTSPIDNSPISQPSLKKLKRICRLIVPLNYTAVVVESQKARHYLLNAIYVVEALTNDRERVSAELYNVYESSGSERKVKIVNVLQALLHLSLCCRGWLNDNDPRPIRSAPVTNQNDVDVRVTESIASLEHSLDECEDRQIILDLPLVEYRYSEWVYSTDGGTTIGERLRILKNEGEETVHSCMRLTSNYFASCAYKYLILIGLPSPFNIEALTHIS